MSEILNILNTIKNILKNDTELSLVNFNLSFPNKFVPNPLIKPSVSIGVKEVKINTGSFDGYLSTKDDTEYYGNLSKLNLALDIYVPEKDGGSKCYDIFYKIYKTLLASNNLNFNITSFSANEITYCQNTGAFLLKCELLVDTLLLFKEITS